MEMMAANFPGAFTSYTLRVLESHQSTKKDVSGTAKAVVESFKGLGLQYKESEIQMIRDPEEQVKSTSLRSFRRDGGASNGTRSNRHRSLLQVSLMNVPKHALDGHAYHTYRVVAPDASVMFEFQHNVIGRNTYAEGTVDACLFLANQVRKFLALSVGRELSTFIRAP